MVKGTGCSSIAPGFKTQLQEALLWPPRVPGTQVVYRHTETKHTRFGGRRTLEVSNKSLSLSYTLRLLYGERSMHTPKAIIFLCKILRALSVLALLLQDAARPLVIVHTLHQEYCSDYNRKTTVAKQTQCS